MAHTEIEKKILSLSKIVHPQQIRWRRHLHQYPEISNEEFETTKYLTAELQKLQIKTKKLKIQTGLTAEIQGKHKGPVVAVRTDIDALPILEQTKLPYASKHKGCMHACGHDMHMATILGVASNIQQLKDEFSGSVRFLFQPSEEMPPGGAKPMIEEGVLNNVDMIFGLHVDPHLKVGKIGIRDGVTMGSVTDFDLIIRGRSGHAARPHHTIDAIVTAAEVIESLQKIVSREIDPIDPVVITFGEISGGYARNVICDEVKLVGTIRTLSPQASKEVPKKVKKIAEYICKARGAKVDMYIMGDYPVLINDIEVNNIISTNYTSLFGSGKVDVTPPVLGGEDFACYLEKVKGAMFRLGVMNKKIKADKPWHSPEFIVDEEALYYGTSVITASIIDALTKLSK